MPWNTWKRLVKKKNGLSFLLLRQMPDYCWPLWRPVIGRDAFSSVAPVLGPSAISCNKLILKTENGGFSTFAGVFDPGTGRIGPAVLKFRLLIAFLRDASNGVGRFFRNAFFFRYTAISSKSVSDVIYPKNRSFFRMKLRHIFETGVAICFLISNSYPEETANAVGCVSQKSQWEFENSGPDSSGPRVKHACEGSETSIFCFQDQFITRDGLIAKNDPQFLET